MHGEDVFYIAQNVYKTSSVVKYLSTVHFISEFSKPSVNSCKFLLLIEGNAKKSLPSCIISLRDALLNKKTKVEIWGGEPRKSSQKGMI